MSGRHRHGRHRAKPPSRKSQHFWLLVTVGAFLGAGLTQQPSPVQAADSGAVVTSVPPSNTHWKAAVPRPKPVRLMGNRVRDLPMMVTGRHGLNPAALAVLSWVESRFPSITQAGGVRPDRLPDHPAGRAVDFMVTDPVVGDRIVRSLLANARTLGVKYVIFRQTIHYPSGRSGLMENRGSARENHFDHVHVSVF